MKRALRSLLLTAGLCLWTGVPVHAEPALPVPASYFPAGSWIDFHPAVTNADMDRWWGRDANGNPMMHVLSEDLLARQSGWLESSFRRVGNGYVYFALFRSEYGSLPDGSLGNTAAFKDWRSGVSDINGLPLARTQPAGILPSGTAGQAETRVLTTANGGPSVTIAAWWGTTHEVEALGIFTGKLMTMQRVKRMLADQVRYIVRAS